MIGPARRRCPRDGRGHCRHRRAGPLHDLYAGVGDGPQHRVEGSDASTLAARAAALQTTDPPAAALWAQLDKQLTGLAIWLPTVTPNETGLISRRTGDYQYDSVWERCSTSSGPGKPGPGAGQPDARPAGAPRHTAPH